jgi:hypothetical protein
MNTFERHFRLARRFLAASLPALVALTAATGCNSITHVEDQAVITPSGISNPAGAMNQRAGALSDLFIAFSGQSLYSGLLVDEFSVTSASLAANFPEDQRNLSVTNSGNFPFATFSDGRINAIIAIGLLKQFVPQPHWQIGEMYALNAAVEIEISEDMCSGIPLAVVSGFTPSYGPTLSRQQLVSGALTDLDSAAKYSDDSDSIANFVAVLRGRAYSDNGDLVSASTAVQNVPLSFAYAAPLNDTTAINTIYNLTVVNGQITVSDREGINGLPFVSANDPRVPIVSLQSGGVQVNALASIPNGSTSLAMASGIEAQLIGAEAALSQGQASAWAHILNTLRQTAITPAMDTLTTDSTTGAAAGMQLAVMFRERAFWLFATGHRQGDLRRLVRQYGLPIASVYPIGPYLGGPSQYGGSVVFPLGGEIGPDPGYRGCLDVTP